DQGRGQLQGDDARRAQELRRLPREIQDEAAVTALRRRNGSSGPTMRARMAYAVALAAVMIAAAAAAARMATAPRGVSAEVAAAVSQPGDPDAGKNVFTIAGCEACHMSPGQKYPLRLGGGLELKTPFGSFYPPNISPDRVDGIGAWSAENFADALMAGVSPRGEH